jgi:hypothetical protein
MDSIITALKDTPIPTILVIAGILFLLLSIAGQLAGRIAVPPERQRQAAIMGCLLVLVGVAVHVVPPRLTSPKPQEAPAPIAPAPTIKKDEPAQPPTTSPSTQAPPSTPEPATQDFKVKPVPSLNAHFTALQFYEGNPCDEPPPERRVYRQRFAKVITRQVYTEITLEYPKRDQRLDFTIQGIYKHKTPRGAEVLAKPELKTYSPADSQRSSHWFSSQVGLIHCVSGVGGGRNWSVGSYTVDVYINGESVGSGSFEIYE